MSILLYFAIPRYICDYCCPKSQNSLAMRLCMCQIRSGSPAEHLLPTCITALFPDCQKQFPNNRNERRERAKWATRYGYLTSEGQINATNIFEFDRDGATVSWRWIKKNGKMRNQFNVPPMSEYMDVAKSGVVTPLSCWKCQQT